MSVYITGDGPCPFCGKIVVANRLETHHTHSGPEIGEWEEEDEEEDEDDEDLEDDEDEE